MAAVVKTFFDKRKLALAKAKFRAWWEGDAFNEEAALAAIESAANDAGDADGALFDAPVEAPPPRLTALGLIWGEGRIRPGDAGDEANSLAALKLKPEGVLALLGPGGAAPTLVMAEAHPGRIEVFEWREEAIAPLKHAIAKAKLDARVSITRIDLEAHVFTPQSFDALISIDDFAYSGYAPHLAQQIFKGLKPGACASIDAYVGEKSPALATAFATSFAEPQIRPHRDVVQVLTDVGFTLTSDDAITEAFLVLARGGFPRLSEQMQSVAGLDVRAAQELAWEVEAWRVRMHLLAKRRLERRRLTVKRPA
jgi:cyclopropane fatty-acyl-phospholipid synthase-like methyltransferase